MKNILIFIGIFLFMSNCNQNQNQIGEKVSITSEEALEIAQMHNDYLDMSIPETNGRISSDALRENFLNQEVEGLSLEEREIILNQAIRFSEEDLKNSIDAASYVFIERINQVLSEKQNFEDISRELNVLMEEISSSKIQEKSVLLVYCATGIKSAEFWLPKYKGGSGIGSRIIEKQFPNGRVSALDGRDLVIADALGVSSFFTGFGLFASAAGPVGLFGGAAFAGAFSSAAAALI